MAIERHNPRGDAAWHRLRRRDVTASVVGALFGVHEYVTPYALWAVKAGRAPEEQIETPAMRRGRLLEPVGVQLIREQRPDWTVRHNNGATEPLLYLRDPETRLGATPDVFVEHPERGPGIIQLKSVEGGIFKRKWHGEEGELEPPLWIALQASLEAHLTGARWAAAGALVVGFGIDLHLVDIPLVPGVPEAMAAKAAEFWTMIAEGREPPPDFSRDAALIERIHAEGDEETEVDLSGNNRVRELVDMRAQHKRLIGASAAEVEAIDAEVKALMGPATVAHIGDGQRITWRSTRRPAYSAPASEYRVLRFPKEKG